MQDRSNVLQENASLKLVIQDLQKKSEDLIADLKLEKGQVRLCNSARDDLDSELSRY